MPTSSKKEVRRLFRNACLERDKLCCRVCWHETPAGGAFVQTPLAELEVHHITNRNEMPGGGYVKENGISLCPRHHRTAEVHMAGVQPIGSCLTDEAWQKAHVKYGPEALYEMIGSSKEKAIKASRKLIGG